MDIAFFIVCKIYFLLGFMEAFESKGIINTLKKELRQPWNVLT